MSAAYAAKLKELCEKLDVLAETVKLLAEMSKELRERVSAIESRKPTAEYVDNRSNRTAGKASNQLR